MGVHSLSGKPETKGIMNNSYEDRIRRYLDDPCSFAVEVCGFTPSSQQEPVLRAMAEPGSRISVRQGHGVGTTSLLCIGALWMLSLHLDAKIVFTAPTLPMLFNILWPELKKWKDNMIPEFRDRLKMTENNIAVIGNYSITGVARIEKGPELFMGVCSNNVLFIADQPSQIPDEVFDGAEGYLGIPSTRMWMMGCPLRDEGFFYRSQHGPDLRWKKFCLPSTESPFVDPGWVERMKELYGEESAIYRTRVTGEFEAKEGKG